MKRKITSILAAAVLLVGLVAVPCGQTYATNAPGIVPSITIAAPWDSSVTFTFTNVYELCEVEGGKIAGVIASPEGTMLISKSVNLRYGGETTGKAIAGNTAHSMLDLFRSGGGTAYEPGKTGFLRLGVTNNPDAIFSDTRRSFSSIKDFAVTAAPEPEPPAPEPQPPAPEPQPPAPEPEPPTPEPQPPAPEPQPPAPMPQPPVSIPASPSQYLARPTSSVVIVDGSSVSFDAYNINGNNYFKLRDLAFTLSGSAKQFGVSWNGEDNLIALTSGEGYTAVGGEMSAKGQGNQYGSPTSSKILLDGAEVSFTAYNIYGNNYFKLRDIGQTFDFGIDWDGSKNTIAINTEKGYVPEGEESAESVAAEDAPESPASYPEEINNILESISSAQTQSSYLKNFPTVPEPSASFGLDPQRATVLSDTADLVVYNFDRKGAANLSLAAFEEKVFRILEDEGFRHEATVPLPSELFGRYIQFSDDGSYSVNFQIVRKGDVQILYASNAGGAKDVDVFIAFKIK